MRRIKILQLVPSLGPGGYERVVCHICRNISHVRYEIAVCCLKHIGLLGLKLREDGIQIKSLSPEKNTVDKYFAFSKILRIISAGKFDVVHTHSHFAFREAVIARLLCHNFRLVHTFHFGDYPNLAFSRLLTEAVSCRVADALIAVSENQRHSILEAFRLNPQHVKTVLNGVAPIHPHPNPAALRQKFGIPENARIVGTVGLIHKQKNYPAFLEVARRVISSNPNVYFIIIGRGILEKEIKSIAKSMGIDDKVIFAGLREDATDIIQIYDVFLLTSLWEAMPMVLLEAIAAGLPVVATNVGENSKIVLHGQNGYLTPVNEIAALTQYLKRLLDDDDMRDKFGATSRIHFKIFFSARVMASNYERIYSDIIRS